MDLGLRGKVALVLGAGDALGGAIARALAAEGAKIAVADVGKTAADETAAEIVHAGGTALAVSWDPADHREIAPSLAAVEAGLGRVDVLVHHVGAPLLTVVGQEPVSWRRHFEATMLTPIMLTDAVLPTMRRRRWGRIIISAASGVTTPAAYPGIANVPPLGLIGWSKTLAAEVGRDGITANVALAGCIATRRLTMLDEQEARREGCSVESIVARRTASIPLGRDGSPREHASLVAFLASERASYLTGSVIRVDGGMSAIL